jgi:hypothetical protein
MHTQHLITRLNLRLRRIETKILAVEVKLGLALGNNASAEEQSSLDSDLRAANRKLNRYLRRLKTFKNSFEPSV